MPVQLKAGAVVTVVTVVVVVVLAAGGLVGAAAQAVPFQTKPLMPLRSPTLLGAVRQSGD